MASRDTQKAKWPLSFNHLSGQRSFERGLEREPPHAHRKPFAGPPLVEGRQFGHHVLSAEIQQLRGHTPDGKQKPPGESADDSAIPPQKKKRP
eukprot:CAMPEP_0171896070 /NCGR_PEP_ID=MMETSP0992-20121227/47382_1 /TAXON_ID=483369 /ORGANISM="non described non described, Strain CCMP2098" /LENGTH=92 /DNA_ID=CAMNT_0012524059 /DNA_START=91 /DNA_END=370 /DNA_ORIENTATION=-